MRRKQEIRTLELCVVDIKEQSLRLSQLNTQTEATVKRLGELQSEFETYVTSINQIVQTSIIEAGAK